MFCQAPHPPTAQRVSQFAVALCGYFCTGSSFRVVHLKRCVQRVQRCLRKLLGASCSVQVAPRKSALRSVRALCACCVRKPFCVEKGASCSAQAARAAAVEKVLCAESSAQVALRKLLCASVSARAHCTSCSAQVCAYFGLDWIGGRPTEK